MPARRSFDTADVDALVRRHDGVLTHAQLAAVGVPRSTVVRWAASGPWRRVLPGVVIAHRGVPTRRERRLAALAYAGPQAVLSGHDALDVHSVLGNRIALPSEILVIIPDREHRKPHGFVIVERSERDPGSVRRQGLPVTSVARASADAARYSGTDENLVRELFGAALQRGTCSVDELRDEVLHGPRQRSRTARKVLSEVWAGVRSAAEGRAYVLISSSPIDQPVWNEDVVINGVWIGQADAYWPRLAVVLEIDGMRWHLGALDMQRTLEKQRRYAAAGILLVSIAPAEIMAEPEKFIRAIAETLDAARRRRAS
ncbi:MAG: type IV toxin-antitoxin system AbiEi family antitoxin domain-containing protein [Janthinobacterium lividum]